MNRQRQIIGLVALTLVAWWLPGFVFAHDPSIVTDRLRSAADGTFHFVGAWPGDPNIDATEWVKANGMQEWATAAVVPPLAATLPPAPVPSPQPPAAKPLPIAFIGLGSDDRVKHPAANPIGNFVDWADGTAPRFKAHGITRGLLHNPGGQHFVPHTGGDSRPMRVDQWEISERRGYLFANREDFRSAVHTLRRHGVTEVIVYVGSPTQLLDPVTELPQVLRAFTDCGGIVSFCFDAALVDADWRVKWAAGSPYRTALANLRKQHRVYVEPRLSKDHVAAGLGKIIDGTVAESQWDAAPQPHDYNPVDVPGHEKIRITAAGNHSAAWPEIKSWPATVTPCLRSEYNWGPLMDQKGAK